MEHTQEHLLHEFVCRKGRTRSSLSPLPFPSTQSLLTSTHSPLKTVTAYSINQCRHRHAKFPNFACHHWSQQLRKSNECIYNQRRRRRGERRRSKCSSNSVSACLHLWMMQIPAHFLTIPNPASSCSPDRPGMALTPAALSSVSPSLLPLT